MKYKIVVLFVTLSFLLFGCGKSEGNGTIVPGTPTVPSSPTTNPNTEDIGSNTEETKSNVVEGTLMPNGAMVHPDGSITLPEIEFDDAFHENAVIAPVTKPTEPLPTEAPENNEEETESVTSPTEPPHSDTLPEDVWE